MVPPPPAMSKLRMQPTVSPRKPPSIWLRENPGCHSGRPLKSRIVAQTLSTGALITALTNTLVMSSSRSKFDALEAPRLLGQRDFGRQSFHAAGAVEAMAMTGVPENILRILGSGDGTTVAQHDDVITHLPRRAGDLVDQPDTGVECLGRGCADASSDGDAHVRHHYIGARAGHCACLVGREYIGRG